MREAMCEVVLKKTDAVQKFVCDFNVKSYLEKLDIEDDLVIKTPNEILHLNMDAIKYVFIKGLLGDPMAVLVSISQKGGKITNVFMSDAMSTSLTSAWEVARKGRHIGLLKAFDNNGAFLLNMKDIIYISSHSLRCLEMKPEFKFQKPVVTAEKKTHAAPVKVEVNSTFGASGVSGSGCIGTSGTGAGSYAMGGIAKGEPAPEIPPAHSYAKADPVAKGAQDLIDSGKSFPRLGIKDDKPTCDTLTNYMYRECTCGLLEFDYIKGTPKRIKCRKCNKFLTFDSTREKKDGNNHKAIVYTNYYMPSSL